MDLKEPAIRRMVVLMFPALLGAGATQINTIVDRILASGLPEGSVAALNYANKLMQLAPGIIGASIITVIYPTLANLAAKRDWERFNAALVNCLGIIQFLLTPVAVVAFVLREPLVRVVYERGVFDAVATQETAWALLFLSMGIPVLSMRNLVSRAFFTLQDTKTPLMLGLVTVGFNVVLNFALIGPLKQGGLALATVIATTVGFICGLQAYRRKGLGRVTWEPLMRSLMKTALASLFMGAALASAYPFFSALIPNRGTVFELLKVGLATGVSTVVFLVAGYVLRIREMRALVSMSMSAVTKVWAKLKEAN